MRNWVWVGWDPREQAAFKVAAASLIACRDGSSPITISKLSLEILRLQDVTLYTRPHKRVNGQLWDVISQAPMSTEFAISRFLVPIMAPDGWSLFVDGDVLFRRDVGDLFALADDRFAVMCVKHDHQPDPGLKMDDQLQTTYRRKNWSSVMLINGAHPGNRRLTLEMVNTLPGRDLHRFCWLEDDEIGELPLSWNWLAGVSEPLDDPALVHFTLGTPDMPKAVPTPFDAEWRGYLA